MDDLRELAIGFAASSLSFFLGIGLARLHSWRRHFGVRRFWRPLTSGGLTLVLGSFRNDDILRVEPSGVVGIGDLRGLHELIEQLGGARLKGLRIEYADTLSKQDREGNLVLLGGGDTNQLTPYFMREVGAQSELVNEAQNALPSLRDNAYDDASIRPELAGDRVVADCGVLIRARNPLNPDRWVVIIAGCLGFGTWAGVRLTTSDDLRHAPDAFECVFRATVDNGLPGRLTSVTGPRRLPLRA